MAALDRTRLVHRTLNHFLKRDGIKRLGRVLAMIIPLAFTASVASAQDYPSKPIKLIVPWPPGGGADVVARQLVDKLGQRLGHPIIVLNAPGATATVGTRDAAQADPDGYTLLLASSEHAINQAYFKNLPYDGIRDFKAIAGVAVQPIVLSIGKNLNISTFKELLQASQANPRKITYANWGKGSLGQLGMELIREKTGLELLQVPYRGSLAALTDVLGGTVDTYMGSFTLAGPQYKAGQLKFLVTPSAKRFAGYPEVPTFQDLGFPSIVMGQWYGLLAPAQTPQPIVDRLAKETLSVVQSDGFKKFMPAAGLDEFPTNVSFDSFLRSEVERWTKIVKDAGITPD